MHRHFFTQSGVFILLLRNYVIIWVFFLLSDFNLQEKNIIMHNKIAQ